MSAEQPDDLTFEEALRELERVVDELERGDLTLEQSLVAFERGMQLKELCIRRLAAAERRVATVIAQETGVTELQELDADAGTEA